MAVKDSWKGKNVAYLGGSIIIRTDNQRWRCKEGTSRRNAWRKVRGVMMDRKISRMLKGKVLDSYVVLESVYGLVTVQCQNSNNADYRYARTTG